MSQHRIDLAIYDGMLTAITVTFGRALDRSDAELIADDVYRRIIAAGPRPAAVIFDLRGLFIVDELALNVINGLEDRLRRIAHMVDANHIQRMTPQLEELAQFALVDGRGLAPIFTTHAEVIAFLTGSDAGFESSVA